MDALEVCVSGVIACLDQSLVACLHQSADTAAEDSLLTEQVGLGLGAEVGLQNTSACAADAQCICQTDIPCVAGSILLNSDQAGYALAYLVLGTYGVAGALGSDHDNVNVLGGLDAAEVDVEAVCKSQSLALGQVGLDALLVELCLLLVVDEDHNDISNLCSLCSGHNLETLLLGLCPALAALVQTYDYFNAAVLEVECVSVALGAVTDDSNGLAAQSLQIAVLLIENSCHNKLPLSEYKLNYKLVILRIVASPRSRDTIPVRQISRMSKSRIRSMNSSILRLLSVSCITMDFLV